MPTQFRGRGQESGVVLRVDHMRAQSLRGLERNGFVSRTVHADPKLRVEYALTPLGRSTLEPLAATCRWASEHWDELLDAREGGISSLG
ncbi:winged helix-turn-helix transcriptional regulator [Streptomyces sp. enrichment culture]|uniref:winged helix-turn-helix transcriptional regulator n=1 Tax=Streptomyces sp. enrichment culture TaxID=1795815 RepID=UPI003F556258